MRSRRLLFLLVLPLGACAAGIAGLVPSGPRPDWADLREDPEYPKARFVTGVGQLPVGSGSGADLLAQLDAAARRELAKTLQVQVKSAVDVYEASVSTSAGSQEVQIVQAQASELVDMQLSGVQIARRWRDERSGTVHALAVLDRQKAAQNVRVEAKDRLETAEDAARKGDAAVASGDAVTSLRLYIQARREARAALTSSSLLRALTGETLDYKGVAAYDARISRVLNAVALSAVEGDGQRVAPGQRLGRPLVVHAGFKTDSGMHPVAGLPLAFHVSDAALARSTTGPDGRASASPADVVAFDGAEGRAFARVDWEALGADAAFAASMRSVNVPFRLVRKGLSSTRVVVKILESVEEGSPVAASQVESAMVAELTRLGFDVKDPRALVDAAGGEEQLGRLGDAELRQKARGLADVLVVGTADSRFHKKFAGSVVYHRARGIVRAVDLDEGRVLHSADLDLPSQAYGQGSDKAGAAALKGLGAQLAPDFSRKLRQSLGY